MNKSFAAAMRTARRFTGKRSMRRARQLFKAAFAATPPVPALKAPPKRPTAPLVKSPARRTPAKRETPAPKPRRFTWKSYSGPAGSRRYKLYVPAKRPPEGSALVLMLHGCQQDPEDFARGTGMNRLADESGVIVAYPEQPEEANPRRCWNWFKRSHQERDAGEPAILAGIAEEIATTHGVDPDRVFVAGLSAGGAMAAVLGETYPDRFAAIGVHSGLRHGAAYNVLSALRTMRNGGTALKRRREGPAACAPRVIVIHGDEDETVHPSNGEQIVAEIHEEQAHLVPQVEEGTAADGRTYTKTLFVDADGTPMVEQWRIHALGHAWSGGNAKGSYTDPDGPDASREMLRFFLAVDD